MADESEPDVRPVAVEHPGARHDRRLRFFEISELLHRLVRDDGHGHRCGEDVEKPGEGLLQHELHRVPIDHLHTLHRLQHVGHRIALHREKPLYAVPHIVGRELAPVDGRSWMPAHTPAQLEDIRRVVRLAPRFGEVAFDRKCRGRDARPCLMLDQPAVRECDWNLDAIGGLEHRVEHRRVPPADGQGAAALRSLRAHVGGGGGSAGQREATEH